MPSRAVSLGIDREGKATEARGGREIRRTRAPPTRRSPKGGAVPDRGGSNTRTWARPLSSARQARPVPQVPPINGRVQFLSVSGLTFEPLRLATLPRPVATVTGHPPTTSTA